jgi:hypothetical protein
MAELLNVSENKLDDDKMLEMYDSEMEAHLEERERKIGETAFEALAVDSAAYIVELPAETTGTRATGPNNYGHSDDTPTDIVMKPREK